MVIAEGHMMQFEHLWVFCSKLSDILEIIKVCCRRKRNYELKASGLEQMAELRKI